MRYLGFAGTWFALVASAFCADTPAGRQVWEFSLGVRGGGVTPAVSDGRVFVTTGLSGNAVFALDAKTGRKIWTRQFNDQGPWDPMISAKSLIVTTESCSIYSMDPSNGSFRWSKVISNTVYSFAAADEQRVYSVAQSTNGTAWDLVCWQGTSGKEQWRVPVGAEGIGAPVIDGETAYLTTRDGVLHAIDVKKGKEAWKQERGATAAPVLANGQLLVASETGGFHLMAVEGASGYPAWQYTASNAGEKPTAGDTAAEQVQQQQQPGIASGTSRPCVVGNTAFVGTQDGRLLCVDVFSGERKWEASVATRPTEKGSVATPVVAGGKVYVGGAESTLACIDAEDGKQVWGYQGRGRFNAAPAVSGGRVYALSDDGILHCIEAGSPEADGWPMWGGTPTHTGAMEPAPSPPRKK